MNSGWILWIAALLQGPAQNSQKLTLDDAVGIGVKNAFAVRVAASNVEKYRQKTREALGSLGPKLTLDATYLRNDQKTSTTIGGNNVTLQPLDQRTAKFTLSYPIDIVGVNKLAANAAKDVEDSYKSTLSAEINSIKSTIRSAYFEVLRSSAQVAVQEEALANIRERLRQTRIKLNAGEVAQFDVVRFEAEEQQAQGNLIAAQSSVHLAKNLLNNAMGRPIETPIEVEDLQTLPTIDYNADPIVALAYKNRSELQSTQKRLDALKKVTKSEERGSLPSLVAAIVHNRNLDPGGLGGRKFTTVGTLNLSFPLFDSGITRSRVKAARQDEEQTIIQLEQQKLGVSLEVRQALVNLQNSYEQLVVAKKQVEKAKEAFRIAQVRYSQGGGISLEVSDAQTDLTRAETGEISARYAYLSAWSALQRAVGVDDLLNATGSPEKGDS